MLAWYEAIKKLTEISGAERNAYVAQSNTSHQRPASTCSQRAESYTSENGLDNDEADEVPYSGHDSTLQNPAVHEEEEPLQPPRRPEGGRFPSDIQVNRGLEHRESMSGDSGASAAAIASALPGPPYHSDDYDGRYDNGAYRDAHGTQSLEQSYVVVPPMNQRRRDSPSSWSSDEKVQFPIPFMLVLGSLFSILFMRSARAKLLIHTLHMYRRTRSPLHLPNKPEKLAMALIPSPANLNLRWSKSIILRKAQMHMSLF